MSITVVTPPDYSAFVTHFLDVAKRYTRLTVTSQDEVFTRAFVSAYRQAERMTRRAIAKQTLKYSICDFEDLIVLPRPPLIQVLDVSYYNEDLVNTSVSSSLYHVNTRRTPGLLVAAEGTNWPTPSSYYPDPVTITYEAGYENLDDIPQDLIQAIFMLTTYFYDNRGDVSGMAKTPLPLASNNIFTQYRINIF